MFHCPLWFKARQCNVRKKTLTVSLKIKSEILNKTLVEFNTDILLLQLYFVCYDELLKVAFTDFPVMFYSVTNTHFSGVNAPGN